MKKFLMILLSLFLSAPSFLRADYAEMGDAGVTASEGFTTNSSDGMESFSTAPELKTPEVPSTSMNNDALMAMKTPPSKPAKKQRVERADSFVAGPDWEFDGFVAGGQDEAVKSMFYQGDLIYLNIGSQQGLNAGDRVAIYKRGNKIKDPQTGRFMGYEVRRAGFAQVTDRIDSNTCSVRLHRSFEAIELKDLAKRE